MGVDRTDHIVYGWKLPFDIEVDEDKCLPMIEGHEGEEFTIIQDGMGGEYTVFGLTLNSGGDKYEGWDFVHLDFRKLDTEKVKAKYREVFNIPQTEAITEPYLFIFSHFS
jgi:hypothetical protein